MLRIVLDTNQYISAFINQKGNPARIIWLWRKQKIEIALSPPILEEIQEVLQRTHLKKKYNLTIKKIRQYILSLKKYSITVSGNVSVTIPIQDEDDKKILSCALEANADIIVTGDEHLLNLQEYQGIPIITPAQFLQRKNHPSLTYNAELN